MGEFSKLLPLDEILSLGVSDVKLVGMGFEEVLPKPEVGGEDFALHSDLFMVSSMTLSTVLATIFPLMVVKCSISIVVTSR